METQSKQSLAESPLEELLTVDVTTLTRDQLTELVQKLQKLTSATGLTAALKVSSVTEEADDDDLSALRRLVE